MGTKPLFCNGEEELPSLEEEGGFDQGKEASAGGTGRNPVTAGCHVQIEDDILVQNIGAKYGFGGATNMLLVSLGFFIFNISITATQSPIKI